MSKHRLTKREALNLVTPVVDGEVEEPVREAFFSFIKNNDHVRKQYESEKRLKNLVSERCPCSKAPESLKRRVHSFLDSCGEEAASERTKNGHDEEPLVDYPSHIAGEKPDDLAAPPPPASGWKKWGYAVAASFLILAAFWSIVMQNPAESYNMEEHVYRHFTEHGGKLIPPHINTASLSLAESRLSDEYDMAMTVPSLENAEFKGVVFSNFVAGFRAPLLEYYLPSQDEYIYIFAFRIDDLKNFEQLVRSEEAVKTCNKPQDFHVREVNGKHVVSWKWKDTWYAAISNHNGEVLASLVEPLNYQPAKKE